MWYSFFAYNCGKFRELIVMAKVIQTKKRIVTSYNNLSTELQEELKKKYPLGFTDVMMRIDKPQGDFFYAVPFETEEISYLVKIDVKIDDNVDDDNDNDYYDDDEIKGAEDIADNDSDDDE